MKTMHPATGVVLVVGALALAKVFHMSWFCHADAQPVTVPPIIEAQAVQPAQTVPYSTFAGDANNPLTQPGLLRVPPPTSPNAFIPLPPVKY